MNATARSQSRKIGYCAEPLALPDPSKAILAADDHSITFLTEMATTSDPHGDGILVEMGYYVGSVHELANTSNYRDRFFPSGINDETPLGTKA